MVRASWGNSFQQRCLALLIWLSLIFGLWAGPELFADTDELTLLQAEFLRGNYTEVAAKSQELLNHPEPKAVDDLLYLQGVSAWKLSDLDLARNSFLRLLAEYSQSRWAPRAKEILSEEDFLFSVQVGAFKTRGNAQRLKEELARRGYEAILSEAILNGRRFYRVRVGQFASRQEAVEMWQRLREEGFPGKVVP